MFNQTLHTTLESQNNYKTSLDAENVNSSSDACWRAVQVLHFLLLYGYMDGTDMVNWKTPYKTRARFSITQINTFMCIM